MTHVKGTQIVFKFEVMMLHDKVIDKIVTYALKNAAELFLELEGEFYPFGIVMDEDESVSPFYVKGEDEFPDSNDVIISLRKTLNDYLVKFNSVGAGICYLASKKIGDLEYDLIVLEIIFKDQSQKEEFWYIIEPDKKNYTFKVHEKIDYGRM